MKEDRSLTPQEVADILQIAKNTVYELIKRGEMNAYRVGRKVRIDPKDVEDYKNRTKSQKDSSINNPSLIQPTLSKPSSLLCDEASYPSRGFVISGQDALLDILSRYLQVHPEGTHALRSYVGSYNGLYALYQGKVQLATAHLWDGETNQYNISYVKKMLPGTPAVIIHLACRMQGFYVAKGNPKNITGWEDLRRSDVTIINREKGSGTRVLLDEHLKLMGIDRQRIKGYNRESSSHLAVASTVARGGADLALGNEKTGLQVHEVDFIPLQQERYELVARKEDIGQPPFRAVLEILNSQDFKMELSGIGGYDLKETGDIIAET
ncbi:substrate-binding domain-containing protein [Clostridium formicaceticum]|uniref:Excisionase n=1 Tax=Clostridium formicaceticum TaxID=1497 RepID=A0AAC9RKM1_9CLOT|nr:helix-turn-helix transcriptional regulator [Clostridium formicaceticum]AOY76598.1 excisionase [Clostridium formicaceticum]ARE87018.1 PBP superfamily domain protein [Clostridium formicaceticum]